MYVFNSTSYNGALSCHFIMTLYLDSLVPTHSANSCAAAERGELSEAIDAAVIHDI